MKKNTTFGNAWMHRQLINMLRFVDERFIYVFAWTMIMPVCLLLNTNHSRSHAYRFFRNRIGLGRWSSAWHTYLNHCLFATVVIDRFAMFAGKRFDIEQEGTEYLRELAFQDDGFLMFSSHIGCYEVAGYSLTPPGKRYNALVYGGEKDRIMEGRQEQFSEHNIAMIPVKEDMSHLFKINEALVNQEIVSMPADRVMGSSKTIPTEFLGKTAHFPAGPFAVATMRNLEVLAINVIRISRKKYKIFVVPLAYDKQAPRKQKMEQLAKKYAEELECLVRQYPDQWYNFYDFWADKNAEPSIA